MKLLISQHAVEEMREFGEPDFNFLSKAFKEMEVETFPKIRALLRSDIPDKNGNFIRKFGDFSIVYRFDEGKTEQTIIVMSVIKKKQISHF